MMYRPQPVLKFRKPNLILVLLYTLTLFIPSTLFVIVIKLDLYLLAAMTA